MTKILISPATEQAGQLGLTILSETSCSGTPTLIAMAERRAPQQEVKDYVEAQHPYDTIFTSGWENIEVVELPTGTLFKVSQYYGHESLETMDGLDWAVA